MNKPVLYAMAKNLALLALMAMPAFFLLVWVQALLQQATGSKDLGYVVETGGVYYLANVVPVLLGGLVHQVIWVSLPTSWSGIARRIVSLLMAPLIPSAVLLSWGGPAQGLLEFAVPVVVALVVYVLLMGTPRSELATA